MEIEDTYKFFRPLSLLKFCFIIILSFLLFLSFRNAILFSNEKTLYLLIFFFFQSSIILNIFYKTLFFYNFNIFIILNLIITPFFFNLTFDVPYRYPNSKKELIWPKSFNRDFILEKHVITTDHKGNRTNTEIDYLSKKDDTYRVFAIGASTTEEEGLDDSFIWTNNLIKKIKKNNYFKKKNYEILNFGIGGLRTIHHYFTLKENLKLKPDLLIFLIGVNDWNYHIINNSENFLYPNFEIPFDFRSSLINKFFIKINRQIEKVAIKVSLSDEKKNITINEVVQGKTNPYLDLVQKEILKKKNIESFSVTDIKKVSERYEFWLKKIVKICEKKHLNCLFVDQPTLYFVSSKTNLDENLWMNPPFKNYKINPYDMLNIANLYNSYLKTVSNNSNVKFCEISKKINPVKQFFLDDVHFTPKGSLKVADELYDCIKNF